MNRVILAALIAALLTVQSAEAATFRQVIAAPFKATWTAAKWTGRGIVKINDNPRVQATVRVISTVTTIAGAAFFVKGIIVKP